MNILFIQTGGSIDKDYPKKIKGYAFEITEPAVKRILRRARAGFKYEIIALLQKDSQEITSEDRQLIYNTCKQAKQEKIVITHGTDTIIETATTLGDITNKTIVLTGSMIPEKFKDSDADFNVGSAVGAFSSLRPGVYLAIHGRILPYDTTTRELDTGQFTNRQDRLT